MKSVTKTKSKMKPGFAKPDTMGKKAAAAEKKMAAKPAKKKK